MAGQTLVVEGMTKLVSQGHQVREHSVEIGREYGSHPNTSTGAECAASLAVPGIEVNPGVVKGSGHHVGKLLVKPGKQVHQIIPGILGGVLLASLAHRGEQVVPGQAVWPRALPLARRYCQNLGKYSSMAANMASRVFASCPPASESGPGENRSPAAGSRKWSPA